MDQTPPASQNGNRDHGDGRVVAKWDDLAASETLMCDDLLVELATKGLLQLVPDNASRYKLWRQVFHSGWDSSMSVQEVPSEAPKRKLLEATLRIGTLTEDAVASPSRKRALDGSPRNSTVHPSRRAGQPVYIRPSLRCGIIELGIAFDYIDQGGKPIPTSLVRLDQGMTIPRAISQVLQQYERYESKRINDWNLSVITMWARRRLRVHLGLVDNVTTDAARPWQSAAAPRGEDEKQLEQLVSVLARFAVMKAMIQAVDVSQVEAWVIA